MKGFKPSEEIWARVNAAILGENGAVVFVTLISGMCSLLRAAGICATEEEARAHIAAMMISPDSGDVGSLMPQLQEQLKRLDDGKWLQ